MLLFMSKLLLIFALMLVIPACGTAPNNSKNITSDVGHLDFVADKNAHFNCIVLLTFQQPANVKSIETLNSKISFTFGSGQRLGSRTLDLIPEKTEKFEFSQTFSCDKLIINATINHCRIAGENLECPEINISGVQDFSEIILQASR